MSAPDFPSLDALLANANFVRAAARGVLGGDAEVEDVVQETWLRAMDRQPREPRALRGWLKRIAQNLALDAYRRRRARRTHEAAAAVPEAAPSVADIAQREEARRRLVSVLLALEEPYRSAILLRYYEECPVAEVARRLGVPPETARTRLRRGLERLRERMGVGDEPARGAWMAALLPWAGPPRGGAPLVPLGGVAVKKLAAVLLACVLIAGGVVSWHLWGRSGTEDDGRTLEASASPRATAEASDPGPLLSGGSGGGALPPPVDLDACDRDLDLHGVVVRTDGSPVAGASIQVGAYPWRRGYLPLGMHRTLWSEGPTTRSARNGTFVLRLRRGERVAVRATSAKLAPTERGGCTAGQRLRLVMTAGVTCIVALTGEGSVSAAGTPVRVFSIEQLSGPIFDRRAVAAADGRARFEGLPAGAALYVETEPERLGALTWRRVDLPASGEVTVEMTLPLGRIIRGRVTDVATGAPIARARVGVNWVLRRAVSTDVDGRYELPGWNDAQGANDLHVEAEGYGRQDAVVGQRETVDFALEHGDSVAGRVVDGEGRALTGVRVGTVGIGYNSGRAGGDMGRATESRADGRFLITSLRRDQEHAALFLAEGFGRYVLDFAPRSEPGTIDLGDVVLPATRRLEGRVVDADQKPVSDARVGIRGANADRRRLVVTAVPERVVPPKGTPVRTSPFAQSEDTLTDDLGRFRFADLCTGSYEVRVEIRGREGVAGTFEVPADGDRLDALLVVPSAREIVVRVVDAGKVPIAGAWVQISGLSTSTDARGQARLFLPPGPGLLSVFGPSSMPERRFLSAQGRDVAVDAREIEIVLSEAERVFGIVKGPDGAAVPYAVLFVTSEGLADMRQQADAEGAFSFDVPKGVRLALRVAGRTEPDKYGKFVPLTGSMRDVQAGSTEVRIVAHPAARDRSLRVLVRSPSGDPVPGVLVRLSTRDGQESHGSTDDLGRVVVEQLTAEPWSIAAYPSMVHPREWLSWKLDGVVPDGQEVAYAFRAGVLITGVVLTPDGKGATDTRVQLSRGLPEQFVKSVICDTDGKFTLGTEAEGPVPIVLTATQGNPVVTNTARLEFATLPRDEVVIRLTAPGAGK